MENMQSSEMGAQKVETGFTPVARVTDFGRFIRRSVDLDKVLGKEVEIDVQTRLDFVVEGQKNASYIVSPLQSSFKTRIATNMMITSCSKTSKLLGIQLSKIAQDSASKIDS